MRRRKFPAGTVISVPTASTREAEPWVFTVEGEEALDLPGGKVTALKLIRNPRREFDQTVELWLAAANGLRAGAAASDTGEWRLGRPAVVLHRQTLSLPPPTLDEQGRPFQRVYPVVLETGMNVAN